MMIRVNKLLILVVQRNELVTNTAAGLVEHDLQIYFHPDCDERERRKREMHFYDSLGSIFSTLNFFLEAIIRELRHATQQLRIGECAESRGIQYHFILNACGLNRIN